MTFTRLIAIVRFIPRLRHHAASSGTVHPSVPVPTRLMLSADEVDELAEAA